MINRELLVNAVKNMPKIELSYEELVDKKVYSDVCFILPIGIKCLFWFTIINGEFLCISIPMQGNKLNINNSSVEVCCFNKNICYGNGTLCMGVKIKNSNITTVYDIFYYKNINYSLTNYQKKIETLCLFLSNIQNDVVLSHQLTLFLPQFASNFIELNEKKTKNNNYSVYCYMFANLYKTSSVNLFKKYLYDKSDAPEKIFLIKPCQDKLFDMYDLFIFNKGTIEYYSKAHINKLKLSYELNRFFHNYKYVDNLDYTEESDDENEITSEPPKNAYVKCNYNRYLKLWEPNELIQGTNNIKITTLYEINNTQ